MPEVIYRPHRLNDPADIAATPGYSWARVAGNQEGGDDALRDSVDGTWLEADASFGGNTEVPFNPGSVLSFRLQPDTPPPPAEPTSAVWQIRYRVAGGPNDGMFNGGVLLRHATGQANLANYTNPTNLVRDTTSASQFILAAIVNDLPVYGALGTSAIAWWPSGDDGDARVMYVYEFFATATYPDLAVVPPLRQRQRDDGLGLSGAPRWRGVTSRQSSNRWAGYL